MITQLILHIPPDLIAREWSASFYDYKKSIYSQAIFPRDLLSILFCRYGKYISSLKYGKMILQRHCHNNFRSDSYSAQNPRSERGHPQRIKCCQAKLPRVSSRAALNISGFSRLGRWPDPGISVTELPVSRETRRAWRWTRLASFSPTSKKFSNIEVRQG